MTTRTSETWGIPNRREKRQTSQSTDWEGTTLSGWRQRQGNRQKGGTERHVSTKLSHAYQIRRRKRTGRRALSGPREAYGWGKSLGPCHDRRRERERHDLSTRATAPILRRQLFSSRFPVPIKTPKILSLEDDQSWATGSEQPHQRINQRPFELEPEAFSNRAYVSNAATMASSNV